MSGSALDGGLLWLHLHGNSNERRQTELHSLKSSVFSDNFTKEMWVSPATRLDNRVELGYHSVFQVLVKAAVVFPLDEAGNQGFKQETRSTSKLH